MPPNVVQILPFSQECSSVAHEVNTGVCDLIKSDCCLLLVGDEHVGMTIKVPDGATRFFL